MSWNRAAMVAGAFAVLTMLSCMSFTIGSKVYECKTEDGILVQQGAARIPGGAEQEIYYPIPYASTPNLETSDCWNGTLVIAQWPTHFRVKNTGESVEHIQWTARGVRGVPVVVAAPSLGPPTTLPPPTPIPVDPNPHAN